MNCKTTEGNPFSEQYEIVMSYYGNHNNNKMMMILIIINIICSDIILYS